MKCIVCGGEKFELLHKGTRDIPEIDVYRCVKCGGGMLSSFSHITDQFYEESGMTHQNNGAVMFSERQIIKDDFRRANFILQDMHGTEKSILDFGCGYGGFLGLVRDYAKSAMGIELESAARDYATRRGICVKSSLEEVDDEFDMVTMFHVIEHLVEPKQFLKQIKKFLKSDGRLLIETPNVNDALLTKYHSREFENFTYWGCHVFLYSQFALELLLKEVGYEIEWTRQLQRYPISNHLFWLCEEKPGGHIIWDDLNSEILQQEYERVLANQGMCDTLVVCAKKSIKENDSDKKLKLNRDVCFSEKPQFPTNMLVELTNICNHECLFCAHKKMKRKQGFCNREKMLNIILQARELGVTDIGFYLGGGIFIK